MKLSTLTIKNYRSIRDATIELGDLAVFIGANATGKSAILDALRFLSESVRARDFRGPMFSRGGMLNLAWKGQEAGQIELTVTFEDGDRRYEWNVRLVRQQSDFYAAERVYEIFTEQPRAELLNVENGWGSLWSSGKGEQVNFLQGETVCALSAATAADASFPGRQIAEFVGRWGFFDPSPFLLRRDWNLPDSGGFDPYGRNLGETLYALERLSPEIFNRVVDATRSIVGLPDGIEPRESEDRFYFVQREPGLQFTVNQMGVSSGTLRVLALMTALYGHPETTLVGIEEPENYIHPLALFNFVQHIAGAQGHHQMLLTTHSPLLLDYLDDPAVVNVVKRHETRGTMVIPEPNPEGVRKALEVSGYSLGQHHETKGFGW